MFVNQVLSFRARKKTLPALLCLFLVMLVSVDNSKIVNNFFYIFLLVPGIYLICKERPRLSLPGAAIGVYVVYVAISSLWGMENILSGLKQLKYVIYLLAFTFLVHRFLSSSRRVTLVASAGLLTGVFLEAYGLYEQILNIGLSNWLSSFPRLSNPAGPLNPVYLSICIGLFGFTLISKKVKSFGMSALLVVGVIVLTLPLQSRTMIVSLVVAYAYLLFRRKQFFCLSIWVLLSLIGCVILFVFVDRFAGSLYRDGIWMFSIAAFLQDCSLIFGCGNRYDFDIVFNNIEFYHPHSVILSQLLYGGAIGGLLLSAVLWFVYKKAKFMDDYWMPVFLYCLIASLAVGHTVLTHPDFVWILIWLPLGLSGLLFKPTGSLRSQRVVADD